MKKSFTSFRNLFIFLLAFNQITTVQAESESFDFDDLPSLDFDELMATDVQVTSAMKRLQNMSETAASIYVLTNKEIMQSGATSVAQALKLVPGMQVRQIDNNQWAITARSTPSKYSSKLLVMVDGQSIYNPIFAGVYWEALNVPLYDIDRIEVIRGQGGLLWGSNATNGVVNIITKHTADTRGVLVQAGVGSQVDYSTNLRVGGDLANYSSYRISASTKSTDSLSDNDDVLEPNDDGETKSVGARVDLNLSDDISLLAQTQYNHISLGQNLKLSDLDTYERVSVADQYKRDHLEVMARLEHRLSSVSNQMLQVSVSSQKGKQAYFDDNIVMTDIDYQMNTLFHDIQFDWGINGRYNTIDINAIDYSSMVDDIDSYNQFGGFIQAQFDIIPDKLKLMIGDKSERNSFTGWEHQPMARVLWQPHSKHVFWGAVSQGVRIPSIFEYNGIAMVNGIRLGDVYSTGSDYIDNLRIKTEVVGNNDVKAETSISKELGYRYTDNSWGVDISLFHTKAKDVAVGYGSTDADVEAFATAIAFGDYTTAATLINDATYYYSFVSDGELITYGGEASIKWKPFTRFSTELGYSFTSYKYNLPDGTGPSVGYDSILRQIMIKANYSINANHSLFAIYHIEGGEAYNSDDYSVLDLSWNWRVTPTVGLSVTGSNLLYGDHFEYNNTSEIYTIPAYVEPSYLAKLTVEF